MLFTEARFVLFLALVWGVHWSLRGNGSRKRWLLFASYAFYAAWDWRFLGLIGASTAIDYCAGAAIPRARSPRARRALLATSVCVNLGILGLFKYFDFFADSAARLFQILGLPAGEITLGLVLPVGISFYTFQSLSYTIDVYRGRLRPAASPLDFALFVAFFPQLVAGPIVRARELLPQFERTRSLDDVRVRFALGLFLVGFVKKACIADNIAPVVDGIFASPAGVAAWAAWLASALFAVQLYCDFSGYSDMAVAVGALLGYQLPQNFRSPFLARSISDFWRRWHITLGTWLRDYLYVPLGGDLHGKARTAFNILATFALAGLWHGAAWNYVLFGLFFGALLLVEGAGLGALLERLAAPLRHLYVALVVLLGALIFRAPDAQTLSSLVSAGLGGRAALEAPGLDPLFGLLVLAFLAAHATTAAGRFLRSLERLPAAAFAASYGLLVAFVLPWIAIGYEPFIYFQF